MRLLIVLAMTVLISTGASACDGCGCAIGITMNDLLGSGRRNLVSIGWSGQAYQNNAHQSLRDQYHSFQLSARYMVNNRLAVTSTLPYYHKERQLDNIDKELKGIGDLYLGVQYALSTFSVHNWIFKIDMGLGTYLPSGEYVSDLHDRNLPQNFNLGTGSIALGHTNNLAINKGDYGFQLNNSLRYNTSSPDDYLLGHQWVSAGRAYKTYPFMKMNWTLSTGVNYEYTSKEHYANEREVSASGSSAWLLPIELNIAQNNFAIQTSVVIPVKQNYINNELNADPRWSIQLAYLY